MRLGDVANIQGGYAFKSEQFISKGIPIIRIGNLTGQEVIIDNDIAYDELFWNEHPELRVEKGDILVAMSGATVGKVGKYNYEEKALLNQRVCKIVPTDKVLSDYLYFYCLSPLFKEEINKSAFGCAQPNISAKQMNMFELNVPNVEMQREHINRLVKIKNIRENKEKQFELLDELIKSRFVELFGDPVANPKGWDMPLIEDVVANEKNALKAGPFGSALKKEYYVSSGYKIYGQEQVISGDHTFGDYYIDEERYKSLENCAVQAGDALISLVGTYGKLLIMPEEFEPGIINPRLMKITFDKKRVNPYYFQHYFQSDSLKKALAENTHGGTMDILNLGIVRKLAMPLPPLELQNQFVAFVEQTDKSKSAIQQSLDKLETLKKALMQKYFG